MHNAVIDERIRVEPGIHFRAVFESDSDTADDASEIVRLVASMGQVEEVVVSDRENSGDGVNERNQIAFVRKWRIVLLKLLLLIWRTVVAAI